ncbi:MAG: 50S ribosomal protein L10 [Chloroflexota bacterium]
MAVTRKRKQALVAQYQDLAKKSKAVILTSYSGLTVKQLEGLRNQIRELGGEFHIVKNTLVDLAFKGLKLPLPEGSMQGTTAIGFALEDVQPVAKAIVDLTRASEGMRVKGGLIEGKLYDAAQITLLADLPPLPVVRARLLGLLTTPASQAARVLAAVLRNLAGVIRAYSQSQSSEPA